MSNKTNKIIIGAVIIVVVILLGWYFMVRRGDQQTPQTTQQPVQQTLETSTNIVIYSDTGYSPQSLTITKGETVTWKNQSARSMWPASAFHPSHKEYPTTGGCLGSTFDACKGVQPGNSWSFKFDVAGTWKYHDHLSPKNFGVIVVE